MARAQAAASGRNVLVRIGATWCGPCHAFQAAMARPAMARVVRANLVVLDLMSDSGPSTNPGTDELNRLWTPPSGAAFPYYAILAPSGRRLGDEYEWTLGGPVQHAGDLGWFLTVLRRTSPRVDRADLDAAAREAGVTLPP